MSDLRKDPYIVDLATYAEMFDKHPDLAELRHRAAYAATHTKARPDLLAMATLQTSDPQAQDELIRSAKEVLSKPAHPMVEARRRFVGFYLLLGFAALIACTPPLWSTASLVLGGAEGAVRTITLVMVDVQVTVQMALMSVVILMAALGSFTILVLTFVNRAGHETLERGFLWWYLLRPLAAVALAVLFYMALAAGYFNQDAGEGHAALVVAAAVGGLAGLFTDKVLQALGGLLGQTPFAVSTAKAADTTTNGTTS